MQVLLERPPQQEVALTIWQTATRGLSSSQLAAFAVFVNDTDPAAVADVARLAALRVAFALFRDPHAYPPDDEITH